MWFDKRAQTGFVLVLVLIALMALSAIALIALMRTLQEVRSARQFQQKTRAFYQAEAGLNQVKRQIVHGYLDKQDPRFVAFDPLDPETVFRRYVDDQDIGLSRFLEGQGGESMQSGGIGTVDYKVVLSDIRDLTEVIEGEGRFGRQLTLKSRGQHQGGAKSQVEQQLVLSYLPNVIFKYGMLTNRLKECQFCHMHIHGDIGQVGAGHFGPISPHVTIGKITGNLFLSGDFKLDQHPAHKQMVTIDGRIVEGTLDPKLLPRRWPSLLERSNPRQPEIAGFYIDLAERASLKGQSRLTGGEILVHVGQEDRFERRTELREVVKHHVILSGTKANPLKINGPLVIRGDLIIRGTIEGQGTIYVERNIYIVGDVLYAHRPNAQEWKNVVSAEAARRENALYHRDFRFDKLGLFAGGNVLLGDISHSEAFRYLNYFLNHESSGMPTKIGKFASATQAFANLAQYDPLGVYVMDGAQGERQATVKAFYYLDPYEDGSDYDKDQKRAWGEGMQWVSRKVQVQSVGLLPEGAKEGEFEGAWISQREFAKLTSPIVEIDATIYTDGAFTGYKPSNDRGKSELLEYLNGFDEDRDGMTFHGAVIARDIDVLAPGGWYVRYDNRNYVGQGAAFNFEPSRVVEISGWRER